MKVISWCSSTTVLEYCAHGDRLSDNPLPQHKYLNISHNINGCLHLMQFTNSRADSLVYLPEAARLSCNIIHDCFGDDSERVCDSLLQQGQRTFFELVRITARFCSIVHMLILTKNSKQTTGVQKSNLLTFQGLRPRRCEHALLVLIQHNCIQPW